MHTEEQITSYISSQPKAKQKEMQELHARILQALTGCKLWFNDGKDEIGKIVSNPSIGYGVYTMHYADGKRREFFQIGLSGNTAGLSVYIMGLKDKSYLTRTYSASLGKASVTGYCIKFKKLNDIDVGVLLTAIQDGVSQTSGH